MIPFQLVGLPYQPFAPLFDATHKELARVHARRFVADAPHAYPCRVSLVDAEPGEEVLLLPFEHLPVSSPYRASGPIFVRKGAMQRFEPVAQVPEYVTRRVISARGYNLGHDLVLAEVCDGVEVKATILRMLADRRVAYIHLHNAKPGCFSCLVSRW